MPYKDPEQRREAQKQYKRARRAQEKLAMVAPGAAAAAPPRPKRAPSQAVKLREATASLLADLGEIGKENWLESRAVLATELIAKGRGALRDIPITNPRDALAILTAGISLMDQVVAVMTLDEGSDDQSRAEMAAAHKAVLSTPEGMAAAQLLMVKRAEQLERMKRDKPPASPPKG